MLRERLNAVRKKILGDNTLFRTITKRYLQDRKYIRGMLLTLYAMPVRNIVNVHDVLERYSYNIIISPQYYNELQDLLTVGKTEGFNLTRIGNKGDGGYVMLDDFGGRIAYSFGISDDVSWDKDIASRGYDVYMYDHTIDGLPEDSPRFHWSKLGLSDGVTQDDRLKSLEELIALNGHEGKRDMILKMDVEGAEWGFLERVKPETLAQFGQITLEMHGMINPASPERVLNALRKLNMTHQLIHLHANNYGMCIMSAGKNFADVLEASYIIRDGYKFLSEYDVNLPLEIDAPNTKKIPEIELGHWNKKAIINDRLTLSAWYWGLKI